MNPDIDLICGLELDEVGVLEKGDSPDGEDWVMYGYASTPARDADQEMVIQKGLNLDPLLKGGWVNYDHDRSNIIGWPTVGEFRPHPNTNQQSLYVEYKLLKGVPMAKRVWDIAKALKANNAPRTLGLSIEGKKRAVSGKGTILKADVLGFAVCPYPKNPETLTGALMKGFVDPDSDDAPNQDIFLPTSISDSARVIADAIAKAVTTGTNIGGTTQTGGGSMRSEEMDKTVQHFEFQLPEEYIRERSKDLPEESQFALDFLTAESRKRDGKITKGEAVLIFSLLGVPLERCVDIAGRV